MSDDYKLPLTVDSAKRAFRAAIIEECARVADNSWSEGDTGSLMAIKIAAAIRALKDKP